MTNAEQQPSRRYIDRKLDIICEQQTRADRTQGAEHDTAIACRNDAALAIRLAFAAMRRQIEALQTQEVTHD